MSKGFNDAANSFIAIILMEIVKRNNQGDRALIHYENKIPNQ
ncbi:unnamed protein product [Acidithrix sp. C25]|nr:unnamed protein product [Acidithrix sp. C25]